MGLEGKVKATVQKTSTWLFPAAEILGELLGGFLSGRTERGRERKECKNAQGSHTVHLCPFSSHSGKTGTKEAEWSHCHTAENPADWE